MKTVLVTGAHGFIGKNLCLALHRTNALEVIGYGSAHSEEELREFVDQADLIFHLAGVNRTDDDSDFVRGNVELTRDLCDLLTARDRSVPLVLSSSIQAEAGNPYGRSKRAGELIVEQYHRDTGRPVYIYRLPNVFGKWSKPDYNTVVATFCYNISRSLPVQVSDRARRLTLVHVDDVVQEFLQIALRDAHDEACGRHQIEPVHEITLGELHDLLISFGKTREASLIPDLSDRFIKKLYSTYLSFCPPEDLAYPVDLKVDERGWLFELVKSRAAGQIFVSRTVPGITRGHHYHDSKMEKFCVVCGEGIIRFRSVLGEEIIDYPVDDQEIRIVDVPPGYTHSIENTGAADMITLFWANEIFDPKQPDTHFEKV